MPRGRVRAGRARPRTLPELGELRDLARDPAVCIGAHTLSHPMLAKHDAAFAEREMAESRARIEAELGRPVRHLSYPVGDPTSAGTREFETAKDWALPPR